MTDEQFNKVSLHSIWLEGIGAKNFRVYDIFKPNCPVILCNKGSIGIGTHASSFYLDLKLIGTYHIEFLRPV